MAVLTRKISRQDQPKPPVSQTHLLPSGAHGLDQVIRFSGRQAGRQLVHALNVVGLAALVGIARARGMSEIAKSAGIAREALYKARDRTVHRA